MHWIVRFLLAAVASAFGCILVLTSTSPIYVLIGSELTPSELMLGAVGILPFALLVGLPIAVPTAAAMGAVMLSLEKRANRLFSRPVWIIVGFGAGVLVSLFFGQAEPIFPVRVASAIWFGLGGAAGAWAFQWVYRREGQLDGNRPRRT